MWKMSLTARITILCENMVGRIGSGEHGFSVFVETEQGNFLFDTGSGRFIAENALAFRKDLRSIEKIFLSHGNDDHTGGLAKVVKIKLKDQAVLKTVYTNVLDNRWWRGKNTDNGGQL